MQLENMRKHLPGLEELMTLWWKSVPPPFYCLPSLASALPLCQSSLWPPGRCGGKETTTQQSESDHQGISQKLNSVTFTWRHVLQFGNVLDAQVGVQGGVFGWSGTPMLFSHPPQALLLSRKPVIEICLCRWWHSTFFFFFKACVLGCYLLPSCYVSLLFKTKGNKAINFVVCGEYGHSVWETL